MKVFILLLYFLFAGLIGITQVIYPYRTCTSPAVLKEFSGLACIGENKLAAINDGGNQAAVYFMDTTGKLLRTKKFQGITNVDWEELFYHGGRLYIADVGDNLCKRKALQVYVYDLAKDSIVQRLGFDMAEKQKGNLSDAQKHYDCEAGFFSNEKMYFFSKTHASPYTGKSLQYIVYPKEGSQVCQATDSAFFGDKGFIYNSLTGAALSPSGKKAAFISCTRLWVRIHPREGKYLGTGWRMDFTFDGFTQKEAITFLDEDRVVVGDETTLGLMGGRMYFYNIGAYLTGAKRYARPLVKQASLRWKKMNTYVLKFQSSETLKELLLVWVDDKGEIMHTQHLDTVKNGFDGELVYNNHGKFPSAYWLVSGKDILFTSKIIFK